MKADRKAPKSGSAWGFLLHLAAILLVVVLCLVLMSGGIKKKNAPAEAAPTAGGEQDYPYAEENTLEFHAYPLEDVTQSGSVFRFRQIDPENMAAYKAFCTDGNGGYSTENGLWSRLPDTETQLSEWEKANPRGAAFARYLRTQNGKNDVQLSEAPMDLSVLDRDGSSVFCLSTTCSCSAPQLGGGAALSAVDAETAGFLSYLKELYESDGVSLVNGRKAAVTYFYETRLSGGTEEERFTYYAYFCDADGEYLLQLTSQYTVVGGDHPAMHNPPAVIIPCLSQEESRAQFLSILTDLCAV